jgi:hypothetical protein
MTSTRLVLTTIAVLASAGATAQNRPPPGPFDGTWDGESAKCFPSSVNYHFASIAVANGTFSWAVVHKGRPEVCTVTINRDGSFASARDCPFQLSGKFQGKRLDVQLKTSERECDVVAKRQ